MVALGKEEFENGLAVVQQAIGLVITSMPSSTFSDAGGKKLGRVLHLHQAEPAGADIRQAIQVAERRDEDVVLARHLKHGLVGAGAEVDAVDDEGFYIDRVAHAVTSSWAAILPWQAQTPAGQRLFSMCPDTRP